MGIILHDITYHHSDGTILFKNLNCSLESGQHVNLIGNNGAGKSTLLQIIAGHLAPSGGSAFTSEKPYYVPQELYNMKHQTVAAALHIEQQITALHSILNGHTAEEYFELLSDQWDIEERAAQALLDWQLDHIRLDQSMQQLSGGEQTRVLLAGMQLHDPSIILLDEPTNHLDSRGRQQLYRFIETYKGTLVVISHDRSLLQLNNTTLALSNGRLEQYGGNYAFYKTQYEEQLNALQQDIHHREKELRLAKKQAQLVNERRQRQEGRDKKQSGLPKILVNSRKNNAEISTAKLQDTHDEKISHISSTLQQQRDMLEKEQPLRMHFPDSKLYRGKILLRATNLNYAYNSSPLWKEPLNFEIKSGERIAIRGNNGSGKTTLLNLLLGKLDYTSGQLERAATEIIYLDQHYNFINGTKTIIEQLEDSNHQHLPEHILKTLLHRYQFSSSDWNKTCAQLSGGEKMKLTLCCLFVSNANPDIIMLDEPGNNLDIKSLEALTTALTSFRGTLLLVSHDALLCEDLEIENYIDLSA